MALYCHQCGKGLPAGARFCSGCGTLIAGTSPQPGRPLLRPIIGRQIAGVCLGIAQANGWDVTAVRILTVVAFFMSSGIVGIAYLAAWIGIPEQIVGYPVQMPPQI